MKLPAALSRRGRGRHIEGFGAQGFREGSSWHLKGGEVGFGGLNFDGGEASKVWEIKGKVGWVESSHAFEKVGCIIHLSP